MSKPRVCDACLAEGAYYRNWWDLMVVANCPIHDRPLLSGDGLSKLRWWCPGIGQMADGRDLRTHLVPRADVIHPSWDSYVLGRMRIIEPLDVPFLDQIALCDVIDCADLIGRAAISGWKQHTPRRPPLHSDARRRCLSLAFDILRDGESSVEGFLETYLSTVAPDYTRPRGVGFYGWLGEACRYLPETGLSNAFKASMNTVAARKGIHRKRGQAPAGKIYTLKDLSKIIGVGTVSLLRIAIDLGLTEQTRNRQLRHWFDDAALGVIRGFLESLVPIRTARSLIGVTPEEFRALLAVGAVRETLRAKTGFMFDPKSLSQLVGNIKVREFAEQVRGRLEAKNCLIDAEGRMALLEKLGSEVRDLDVCSKIQSSGLPKPPGREARISALSRDLQSSLVR